MTDVKSLYIHIPFCISKCKYCDFFSVPCGKNLVTDEYISAICNEILYRIKKYNIKTLDTIYIGGGTPSLLNFNQLHCIFNVIKNNVLLSENCEITIESNPDDITPELVENWKNIGINRISLGIQSFDNGALSYVSRRASSEINKKALDIISKCWNGQLSVDFISGLPVQTAESFIEDLKYIIKIKPDHISMYSLTIEENTPLGCELNKGILDYDFDFADNIWLKSKEFLKDNGYIHYEVSNFSLPGKQCRHNLKYWNHESYVGCGCGGAGTVYEDNGQGHRWTNIQNIKVYCDFWNNLTNQNIEVPEINEEIDLNTSIFEFFMMGLRKLSGITDKRYYQCFGTAIPEHIIDIFNKWHREGLCEINDNCGIKSYGLGHKGILYLNKFLEEII